MNRVLPVFALLVSAFLPTFGGSIVPTPTVTSVFDESLFTEEDEKFIDAENVTGFIGTCSDPFPTVGSDSYFCFYQRGKSLLSVPHVWQYCGVTNCVTNAASALFYLKWHLRTGNLVYRFRTAEEVTPWKTLDPVSSFDWNEDVLITRQKIERPPYPCDMEFYAHIDSHFPYYQYTDYSGTGRGVPGYTEETGSVTNHPVSATVMRETMGTDLQYVRFREFKSRFRRLLMTKQADAANPVTPAVPASYFTSAPLGFRINWVSYDTTGVTIDFETDVPPPYEIGVYRMMEVGLGRHKALAKVVTDQKRSSIVGNFSDVNVFVQVGQKGALGIDTVISKSVYKNYARWIKFLPPRTDYRQSTVVKINARFVQSADYEWSAYLPCETNVVTFSIDGEYMIPGTTHHADSLTLVCSETNGSTFIVKPYATRAPVTALSYHPELGAVTNWVVQPVQLTVPQTIQLPQSVLSVGSGYRLSINEISNTVDMCRAYSARTNLSDMVLVPRFFKAMSTHNGYKYTTDWVGAKGMKSETNYVDGVLYPRGI